MTLDNLTMKWDKVYLRVVDLDYLFTYFNYLESIRKAIYTTNWFECFHMEARYVTKTKDSFSNEEACEKLIYFKVIVYNSTWVSKKLRGFLTVYDDSQKMF
ncbi:MAG: transposase [Epulopiscium sp.]|nr:transposase [Candidatus Epulonipiscium sp.]